MSEAWFSHWDELPVQQFTPTIGVQAVNGGWGQLCRFRIAEGTGAMPPVTHEAEQLSVLVGGRQNVRLGELRRKVGSGALWVIPSGVEHESELLELPSEVLDFHAPYRGEFHPAGEPRPGPRPRSRPTFATWDACEPVPGARGTDVRVLRGERAELRRTVAATRDVWLARCGAGAERISLLVRGRMRLEADGDGREVGAGSVWVLPAGIERRGLVLEAPLEVLELHVLDPRRVPAYA